MAIVCINFSGPVNAPATTKLRNALCATANERFTDGANAGQRKYDQLYLYFSSLGGNVEDGISLFGLIRSLPLEVTIINVGFIASIAIVPFLAGKKRIAYPFARFHFHDYEWNYPAPHNLTRLEYADHTSQLNSGRDTTLLLLKENTLLTDQDFEELKLLKEPTIKDPAFAKAKGIVHEVQYLPVPEQSSIFNVDF